MKTIICGGRDFDDVAYAVPRFMRLHNKSPITEVICGMARGGDLMGRAWALEMGIPVREYPADWNRYGKSAGPIRNQQMLDEGVPDQVIALPGGKGTAHMVSIARSAGLPCTVYEYGYFSRASHPELGWLSNFWPHEQINPATGVRYSSNEHYYQMEKTLDPVTREWIASSPNPGIAKKRGNDKTHVRVREDWETHKLVAMMDGLRMKFAAGSELARKLVETGDLYLVEYAPWGDSYWGVDKTYNGQNWLGKLLMRRRDELVLE